jgi:restriction endonuclease S subunit
MPVVNTNNKCFAVWSNKLEGRLDPHYHKPDYLGLIKSFKNSSFEIKTLREISEKITSGSTPKSGGADYTSKNEGIAFIRSGDINENGNIDFDNILYVKKEIHRGKLKGSQLKKGDVLIAIVGATIGVVSFYNYNSEANINQAIALVRCKKDINPEYIKAFMLSGMGQKQLNKIKRPVARANINLDEIGSFKIPIPPLDIQNEIVEIMQSAYEKKADKEQEAKNILNSIDDYILKELEIKMPEVQDKKCFCINSQEVDKGRLDCYYYQPKFKEGEKSLKKANCETEPLKNYITKIHYGASLKNNYVDEGIPLLRIQNLKPNRIVLTDIVKISESRKRELGNAFVNEGDLLISRSGSVGIVSVVPKEAEGFAFGSFMIKFCLNDKIDKDFVSIWLNNKISQLFIKREKIGAIQGNITIETIENLQIPTPPLETQKKIAKETEERMAQAEKLKMEADNEVEKAKQEVEKIILG